MGQTVRVLPFYRLKRCQTSTKTAKRYFHGTKSTASPSGIVPVQHQPLSGPSVVAPWRRLLSRQVLGSIAGVVLLTLALLPVLVLGVLSTLLEGAAPGGCGAAGPVAVQSYVSERGAVACLSLDVFSHLETGTITSRFNVTAKMLCTL